MDYWVSQELEKKRFSVHRLFSNAPHFSKPTSPIGSLCFAKLSKREPDKSCSFLLPCGVMDGKRKENLRAEINDLINKK